MDTKQNIFDRLENADDRIIEEISQNSSPLGKSEKNRIFSMIEMKYNKQTDNDTDFTPAYEVKGVERYMRPKWYKPVYAAVICLVVIGAVAGGASLMKSFTKKYTTVHHQYTEADSLKPSAEKALEMSFENLTMPDSITLDSVDKFYTFEGTFLENWSKDESTEAVISAARDFAGIEITPDDVEEASYGDLIQHEYNDDTVSVVVSGKYGINFKDSTLCSENFYGQKNIAIYNFDRDGVPDSEYELADDSCTVKESLNYCNKTAETLEKYIHSNETLRAKSMIVTQCGDHYVYRFIYEKLYMGLPVDEGCDYGLADKGFSKPSYVYIVADGSEHISNIICYYPNNYVIDTLTEYTGELLSLESATWILSDYLAEYNRFDVKDIDIKYCCISCTDKSTGQLTEGQFRPMWVYVLKEQLPSEAQFPNDSKRICAYVDMQNSEVYVVDNISHNEYFDLSDGK